MSEPRKCAGWGIDCPVMLTAETEHLFGEVILCESCDGRAWDDYFEAVCNVLAEYGDSDF